MSVNNLDMQKLHLAPKPVQFFIALLVAALLVGAGFMLMFKEQWETLENAQNEEVTSRSSLWTKAVRQPIWKICRLS